MEEIKTVGVKALKDQLSLYLREVKSGNVILVSEHGKVVAELHQPIRSAPPVEEESIKSQWINSGKLISAKSRKKTCQYSVIKKKAGTAISLLNQERGE